MEAGVLKKQILSTIVYYDGLDYPLTAFEVWKYLTVARTGSGSEEGSTLGETFSMLGNPELGRWIESDSGFFFLKGQKELVRLRLRRNKLSAPKLKRLRRIAFWLRVVPFVRMIAVTGRLALKNARPGSDWDLLIVLQSGKIWTGRTLVTLFLEAIGKRRKPGRTRDRVCLNYFITDGSLEIKNKDLFSAHEYTFLFPLWGEEIYQRFIRENGWLENYKPNFRFPTIPNLLLLPDNHLLNRIRQAGELLCGSDGIEDWLRKWEKKKIIENPLTAREGSLITANDESLVFLPEPQGPRVFERFRMRLDDLLIHNRRN